MIRSLASALTILIALLAHPSAHAQQKRNIPANTHVIAFFTAREDAAHISFVNEANIWFQKLADSLHFQYDTTTNWQHMNDKFLQKYQLIIFLDTRPEDQDQRKAFQQFMQNGGAWIGFHFAAFSLKDSRYPNNWSWYHDEFLGCGQYKSNTWKPTAELLHVENGSSSFTKGLPQKIQACPNEWYRWENDLRANDDVEVLLSLDKSTFPVGTGPKQHEIWTEGDYPVAWTNKQYHMVYINMGHNDMDYGKTNKPLSSSFACPMQNQFIVQSLITLLNK